MDHEWYVYIIAFAGALIAGSVNTLAGNGSAITLSILTELIGLPGNLANGTNRIGVVMNAMGSTYGFHRGGKLNLDKSKLVIGVVVLGAIVGGIVAISITSAQFMGVFRFLMVAMLVVILVNPKRWLRKAQGKPLLPKPVMIFFYFLLGVYGGLIQMGMGVFFLAVLVLLDGYTIIHANAIKVTVVMLYTILMVVMFQIQGLIEWEIGLLLGVGQFIGGWYTARLASKHPAAEKWAYGLLVVIVVLSILSLFGVVHL